MKFGSEAKIGIIGILTLAVLIWGINYLKGRNILKSSYTLTTSLHEAGGLESSAPVLLNGIKIGYVRDLELLMGDSLPIKVRLNIEKEYHVPHGSTAVLTSIDLLGTKAIRIDVSNNEQNHADKDIIRSGVELDMLSRLQSQLMPVMRQIGELAVTLDTLSLGLDRIISSESTRKTLNHLSSISAALSASLSAGGALEQSFSNLASFTAMLETQEDELSALMGHLNSIGESLDNAGISELTREIQSVTRQFNLLLETVNSGEGNAGKFFQEDSLYQNLDLLITDLDALVKDINENPKNYVQISLFGNSQKKKR